MKITKIKPVLPAVDYSFADKLLWQVVESIQQQVEDTHRKTIWKHTRTNPYKLSREILERMNIKLVVSPQHNQQWLEQKGVRIGPIIQTTLHF